MVDIRDLGMIPRILFATDGAITHILEAYAGEPIDLVRLDSNVVAHRDDAPAESGSAEVERAFVACSLLRGGASGRVFVHASSRVFLDRLPPAVADELLQTGAGVTKLLSQHRVGTFRECITEWEGKDEHIAGHLGTEPSELLVARTYQIIIEGRPVASITESFVKHGFSTPPPSANLAP